MDFLKNNGFDDLDPRKNGSTGELLKGELDDLLRLRPELKGHIYDGPIELPKPPSQSQPDDIIKKAKNAEGTDQVFEMYKDYKPHKLRHSTYESVHVIEGEGLPGYHEILLSATESYCGYNLAIVWDEMDGPMKVIRGGMWNTSLGAASPFTVRDACYQENGKNMLFIVVRYLDGGYQVSFVDKTGKRDPLVRYYANIGDCNWITCGPPSSGSQPFRFTYAAIHKWL